MFSIGDRAIDKRGRIFKIEETMDKDFGDGPAPYFVMTPCFPYDFNQGYQCFIPVDKADSLLRPLLTRKEAEALLAEIKDIPVLRDIGPHERKARFQNIIASGDRHDILQVIVTLIDYREERKSLNKPFSDFDSRLLKTLTSLFKDEMSIVFDMPPEKVAPYIEEKAGTALFS
ncbi:MAG TPA: hypothetical protein IAC60_01970 [Candidatus Enterosoma merdigallinarum]|nr:hypothetical protein [Candidatus Enterosoma merdigallinarum]